MKFTCKKESLYKAVTTVGRLATTRATLPILQNIYIEVRNGLVQVKSTDLEQTLMASFGAEITEEGKITLPARLLIEYLQNSTDEQITLTLEDITLHLTSKNHNARIKGLAAEEYPTLPEIKPQVQLTLPAGKLLEIINQTIFTAAHDDTRPILTGLLFRFQDTQLTVVGTDGYRLAKYSTSVVNPINGDFIIPRRALQELQKLLSVATEVELIFSSTQMKAVTGETILISRVLDGSYPAYEAIIPKIKNTSVAINVAALSQSLKLASLFSRESAYSTKVELAGNKMKITAISTQLGENTNEIELQGEIKESLTISVNAQYLIDFLSTVSGEVVVSFIDAKSPIVFTLAKNADYLYLVMPLRSE